MAKTDIAVLLALAAAFFIAIGDVIHQRSAHDVTTEPVGHLELFLRLLRDRQWWVGSLVSALGFGCQAAALGLGSVLLVQALLVTSLLFALPIHARTTGHPVTRPQWLWAALLAAAVAVIVTVGNPTEGQARAGFGVWGVVIAVMVPALVLCVVGARVLAGQPAAAVLLGVVSGSLWGLFAVLLKGVVERLDHGIGAVLETPELYAAAAVSVAATAWQQSSFRAGSLTASLPTMTVAEPAVGSLLGIVVLGEAVRPGKDGWAVLLVAVVAMVIATAALARSQASSEADG
ncbi:MAG TPA: DMT family transporter [Mycobacterium sp.]|nr:DMT family transporter [Mycobacterium sp.]HQC75231.1 DMT family transporter [Mycobacterium sp.]